MRPRASGRLAVAAWLVALLACTAAGAWLGMSGTPPEPPVMPDAREGLSSSLAQLLATTAQAVSEQPGDAARHGQLGLAYEANGLWSEAERAFAAASRLSPRDASLRLHRAIALTELARHGEAVDELRLAIAIDQASAPAWHRLALLLLSRGDVAEAEAAFERVARLAPRSAAGPAGIGKCRLRLGDPEGALARLDEALRLEPEDRVAHSWRGQALLALGRDAEAEIELRIGEGARWQALADPASRKLLDLVRSASSRLKKAEQALAGGRPDLAIRWLEAARADGVSPAAVLSNLGTAYLAAGRLQDARRVLEEALAAAPDYVPALVNLGEALGTAGDLPGALRIYDRAVAVDPGAWEPHVGRGRVLMGMGRRDEALAALQRGVDVAPREGRVRLFLGQVLVATGRRVEGVAEITKACAIDPGSLPVQMDAAEAYVALGMPDRAREALAAARRISRSPPGIEVIEARLAAGASR